MEHAITPYPEIKEPALREEMMPKQMQKPKTKSASDVGGIEESLQTLLILDPVMQQQQQQRLKVERELNFTCGFPGCGKAFTSSVECHLHAKVHLYDPIPQAALNLSHYYFKSAITSSGKKHCRCKWYRCHYHNADRMKTILHVAFRHFPQVLDLGRPETTIGPDGEVVRTSWDYLQVIEKQLAARLRKRYLNL